MCVCVCPPLAALRHYFLVNRHLPTLHTNVGQWLNAARERGGGGGGGGRSLDDVSGVSCTRTMSCGEEAAVCTYSSCIQYIRACQPGRAAVCVAMGRK